MASCVNLFSDYFDLASIVAADDRRALSAAFKYHRQDAGVCGTIPLSQLEPADVEGGRQPVSDGSRIRNNGNAAHCLSGLSGSRINDVAVPFSAVFEKLLLAPAGRHPAVSHYQYREPPVLLSRVTHSNHPSRLSAVSASDRTDTA